ncbi:MAG: DUF4959 domain-containing protein [Tannerella sp.]|jgi:hypothetical protein|nr:DUF4959 domain-containing protein [Tannerella sp.]
MKSSKLNKFLLPVLLLAVLIPGCIIEIKDYSDIPDKIPPGQVKNVTYTPSSGGVTFRYTLPDDEDLMGVKAVYTNERGTELVMRSSAFIDSLIITGLGTTDEQEVKLYTTDNSNNESEAVTVTIIPGQPEIYDIVESVVVEPYSGGVRLRWNNPNKKDVAVELLYMDATEEYIAYETFYSNAAEGHGVKFGGLEQVRSYFGVYVRDRWGNKSPVKYYTVIPDPYLMNPYLANKTSFKVMQFVGNAMYAEMNQVSYEVWVNMHEYPSEAPFMSTIIGVEDGTDKTLMIRIVNQDVVQLSAFGGGLLSNTHLERNKWYHLAATYDGSMVRLYINGRLDASRSQSGYHNMSLYNPNDGAFMIGQSLGARLFDGEISDIRIWSTVRTENEIKENLCSIDPETSGLIANWKFDDRRGTTIKDYSPNKYDIEADKEFEWVMNPSLCENE